jgi:C-terminal processing protease CtpA/Prc
MLVYVDELCFSCGDFVPAILQDNGRAILFGKRTAGAGGYVLGVKHPNLNGIRGFTLTGSIAERKDLQPIENLGVTPDIAYELTIDDARHGYRDLANHLKKAITEILR